jgi:hypothetical protein
LRIGEDTIHHWRNCTEEKLPLYKESEIWQNLAKRVAGETSMRGGSGRQR